MKGAKVSVLETLILKAGGDRQLDLAPKELGTWDPKKKCSETFISYVPLMEYHTRGGEGTKKKKKLFGTIPGQRSGYVYITNQQQRTCHVQIKTNVIMINYHCAYLLQKNPLGPA